MGLNKDIFAFVEQHSENAARYYIAAEIATSRSREYSHGFVTGYMINNPEGNPFDEDSEYVPLSKCALFIQPHHNSKVVTCTHDLNYSFVEVYETPLDAHMDARRMLDEYEFFNDYLVLREAVPGAELVICSKEDAMRYQRRR